MAAPPPGFAKLSVDGAYDTRKGTVGLGIVAHDHDGNLLGACFDPFKSTASPQPVEAMAFRKARLLAK